MAQKITTLTYLPLVETASLDPILAGVKKVDGVAQAYYGRRLEDNGILTLAVDWAAEAHLDEFKQSVLSGEINQILQPSLKGEPVIVSFTHGSGPGTLLDTEHNPVTEIATFYFRPDITDDQLGEFDQAFVALENAVRADPGQTTATAGHALGLLNNPDIGADVKGFIATVGWESLEAHVNFTKTPQFGESLGGLVPFLSGNADHHVYFTKG